MFPAQFDYRPARSVDEAIAALAQYGGDARVLAGGQSLIPAMRFRLGAPGRSASTSIRLPSSPTCARATDVCRSAPRRATSRSRSRRSIASALPPHRRRVGGRRRSGRAADGHASSAVSATTIRPATGGSSRWRARAQIVVRGNRKARERSRSTTSSSTRTRRRSPTARWRSRCASRRRARARRALTTRSNAKSATSRPHRPRCRLTLAADGTIARCRHRDRRGRSDGDCASPRPRSAAEGRTSRRAIVIARPRRRGREDRRPDRPTTRGSAEYKKDMAGVLVAPRASRKRCERLGVGGL